MNNSSKERTESYIWWEGQSHKLKKTSPCLALNQVLCLSLFKNTSGCV